MFQLPPMFAWETIHPIIVHFPVALLLTAPLFLVLALLLAPARRRPFLVASLLLMALGTAGAYLAVATGEATEERAESVAAAEAVLEEHEELAEQTRSAFTLLTLAFAAILFAPILSRKRLSPKVETVLLAGFLVLYIAGTVVLADTAHQGGRLVHEFGVQALPTALPSVAVAQPDHAEHDD